MIESDSDLPAGFEEAFAPIMKTPPGTGLDRLCRLASEILEVSAVALLLDRDGVIRVIASDGLSDPFRAARWQREETGFAGNERVIVADARTHAMPQHIARHLGLAQAGKFLSFPVMAGQDNIMALVAIAPVAGQRPSAPAIEQMSTLTDVMASEAAPIMDAIIADLEGSASLLDLADLVAQVENGSGADFILDRALQIVAASQSTRALLARIRTELRWNDTRLQTFALNDTLKFYCCQAFETQVTPPEIEIMTGPAQTRHVYAILISPRRTRDADHCYLHGFIRDVTKRSAMEEDFGRRFRKQTSLGHAVEPSLAFLKKTLVERHTLRSRKDLSYLTLRAWRRPIREFQIEALKSLKTNLPVMMPEAIGEEIVSQVSSLIGIHAFNAVVPIPCGHTRTGPCLSIEIARAISQKLSLPMIQALESQPLKGSSHPKEIKRRPAMVLVRPVTDSILLVDDVATSGAHLEEAAALLRPYCKSLLAVAWIGGDAT